MKVLTSGAAIMILGPDFVFRTELIRKGNSLIIRGDGDPALADPEVLDETEPRMTADDVLEFLANAARKDGMTSAEELIVDDRVFDREFLHPEWPEKNLMMPHSAQISGLNFHANVLSIFPKPSREGVGRPPTFTLEPDVPWMPIENRGKTVNTGNNSPWLSREKSENAFVLRGDVRQPLLEGIRVPIHNPPELFGMVLAQHLNAAGVAVAGGTSSRDMKPKGVRMAPPTESLKGGKVIAVVSTPISKVLERCNADSSNLYAESLLKRAGKEVTKEPGSWSNGTTVLRMSIAENLGAEYASTTTVSDGSGISRSNAVAPNTLTRWLILMASNRKYRDVFSDSFAKPGTGTLKKRFRGVNLKNQLRAKSGFIDGVRSLSGYVISPETGRRVAFSVIVNDIRTGDQTQAALDLHEDVVLAVDKWLYRQNQPASGG
jgi:D-alanyl-D-alanine carboxypeptidase/D-alanyl-D-alanine-endopeptidase (penicillin-binding protein 4)